MALPARPIHVPAGLPIDEASRAEHVPLAQANLSAENVRVTDRGALDKRYGFTALTSATGGGDPRSSARRLFAHDKQICVIDATADLDAYSPTANINSVGGLAIPRVQVQRRPVIDFGPTLSNESLAHCNGYYVILSPANDKLQAAVVDASNGTVISTSTLATGLTDTSIGVLGTRVFAFYVSGTGLMAQSIDVANASSIVAGWSGPIVIDAVNGNRPSVCPLTDRIAIGYAGGGPFDLIVATIDPASLVVIQSRTIASGGVTAPKVSVGGSQTDILWVAFSADAIVKVIGLDPNNLSTTLGTTATVATFSGASVGSLFVTGAVSAAGQGAGEGAVVAYAGLGGSEPMKRSYFSISGGAVTPGATATWYWVRADDAFLQGGRLYAIATWRDPNSLSRANPDNVRELVDVTMDHGVLPVVAHFGAGVTVGEPFGALTGRGTPIGTTKYAILSRVVSRGLSLSAVDTALEIVEFDFGGIMRWRASTFGQLTTLAGGVTCLYDGVSVFEAGFLVRPGKPTATLGGTGLTGTFRYVAVYEHTDSVGNVHISGVSDPSDLVTAADDTVTVTVPSLFLTRRGMTARPASVALYRTATGGEPPYYRLYAETNDTTAPTVTFVDNNSDSVVRAAAQLYRQPGVLGTPQDRRAPTASRLATVVNDSIVTVGDDAMTLWQTGQPVSLEGPWWNPLFTMPLNEGGPIVAIDSMDGATYVFKRRSIFVVPVEPLNDAGTAGGMGAPRRLATEVGASQVPTCVTSLGIFFVSDRGIELLTRAQTVDYIGEPVKDTLAAFPFVTAMTFDASSSCVLVELAASLDASGSAVTGTGRTLVFDTTLKGWYSVDRRRSVSGTADTPAQDAAIVWNGSAWRYAWLGTDGAVYVEDHTKWLDADGSFVVSRWEPAEIKLGLQQDQRIFEIKALFERYSDAGLVIETALDRKPYGLTVDKVWTAEETASKVQLELRPKPHNTSLRTRWRDTAPAVLGTGRGFAFVGFSIDIAPKQGATQGTTRLPAEDRR